MRSLERDWWGSGDKGKNPSLKLHIEICLQFSAHEQSSLLAWSHSFLLRPPFSTIHSIIPHSPILPNYAKSRYLYLGFYKFVQNVYEVPSRHVGERFVTEISKNAVRHSPSIHLVDNFAESLNSSFSSFRESRKCLLDIVAAPQFLNQYICVFHGHGSPHARHRRDRVLSISYEDNPPFVP